MEIKKTIKKSVKKVIFLLEEPIIKINIYSHKRKLKNNQFTIISNNCWGGFVYQDHEVQYNTPFIGLFLHPKDYIKLMLDLNEYLGQELIFTEQSKYDFDTVQKNYPIGMLGDVEIHFLHYKDKEEAYRKWKRRLERINYDNLFVAFAETKACSAEDIADFHELDFDNKVCFTANEYLDFEDCVWIKNFSQQGYLSSNYLKKYKKYFNVTNWLNRGGSNFH